MLTLNRKLKTVNACKRLFLLLLFGLVIVSPVSAHGFIVRAIPPDRAVLDRAPTRVQYWFSESLEVDFSSINVRDQTGQIIASGGVDPANPAGLVVQLPRDLPDGAYIVELRPAFASDGHVNAESRVFFVGTEVGGVSGQANAGEAIPLEVIWRALVLSATMLVFGACTLYSVVLLPAWGSREYPAGHLPPRVMQRLYWIVGVGLALAILGNIIGLLQQSMTFFNVGLDSVLSQGLWNVVRIGSRFGDIWNFRMFALGIAAVMFGFGYAYRQSQPELTRAFWTANAWLLALVVGSFSVVSHAAGSLMLPWAGIAVDWMHGVGVGFWVGGLMALVLVLPVALQPYTGEPRRLALLAVLRHFSRVAAAAVVIVIASGIYSAATWVDSPTTLTQSNFGLSLLLKLALVGGLLVIGAIHQIASNPERFARLTGQNTVAALPDNPGDRRAVYGGWGQRLFTTLRLEVIIALAVLTAAGLLSATPVPVPDYVDDQPPAPQSTVNVNGYTITQTISPGGPGINTSDTVVTRNDQPVDDVLVQIQHVYPERDLRRGWQVTDAVGDGLYIAADGGIDRAGAWWTLVDLQADDGTTTRAAFTWDIRADAAVIQAKPPEVQHLVALGLVIAAVIWVSLPLLRRIYGWLNLNPTTATIAIFTVIATILMMGASTVFLNDLEQQNQDALNPIPVVINTVLPDQASLERGASLLEAACTAWSDAAVQSDLAGLQQRLPAMRDAAVFEITQKGWRSLPPCAADLSVDQRWDLVNYLRSL